MLKLCSGKDELTGSLLMTTPLPRSFFDRSALLVAREIIGKKLVRTMKNGNELSGIIVEAEAYGGNRDPASHAFRGKTIRNEVMFGEAGHAYVYFTYGAHYCLNFVTSSKIGKASAVLIRAIEPISGINLMISRRKTNIITQLANGPGKLTQAFEIDKSLNGIDVTSENSPLRVENSLGKALVRSSERIGINVATDRKWRFFSATSPFVSRHSSSGIPNKREG
jgi:DNA-3-methyladenine glycosylase